MTRQSSNGKKRSFNKQIISPLNGPVTPVDVFLKNGHSKHVHVVVGQHQLPVLSSLQVDALNLVCPGITPIQQTLLQE